MTASYQIQMKGRLVDVPVVTSLYFSTASADNSFGEAVDVNDGFVSSGLFQDYLDCVPDDYTLESIETRGIVVAAGGVTATPAAVFTGLADPGTRTGEVQSNQNGPLLSYFPQPITGQRARVCKIFFPGLTEADGAADVVAAGVVTAIETFALAVAAGFTYGGPGPAQWRALIKNAGAKTFREVVAYAAEVFVASQNRRRPEH